MAKAVVQVKAVMEETQVRSSRRLCDRQPVKLLEWKAETAVTFAQRIDLTHRSIVRDWGINE